jgi:hypothetical protein
MSDARRPVPTADPLVRALVAAVREIAQRRASEVPGRRGNVGSMDGGKAA